jgi:hypothetical protein
MAAALEVVRTICYNRSSVRHKRPQKERADGNKGFLDETKEISDPECVARTWKSHEIAGRKQFRSIDANFVVQGVEHTSSAEALYFLCGTLHLRWN